MLKIYRPIRKIPPSTNAPKVSANEKNVKKTESEKRAAARRRPEPIPLSHVKTLMSVFTWERGIGSGLLLAAALFSLSVFFTFFSFAETFGAFVEGGIFLIGLYILSIDLICQIYPQYRAAHILESLGDVENAC